MVMAVYSIRVVAERPIGAHAHVRLRVLGRERRADTQPSGIAEQVARYGDFVVYLLDGTATLETSGFWLSGERRTALVLAALDGSGPPAALQLEAADVRVDAVVMSGAWRHSVSIEARQHVDIALPPTPSRPIVLHIEVRGGQRGKPAAFVRVLPVAEPAGW
jgi:hypothetical protein